MLNRIILLVLLAAVGCGKSAQKTDSGSGKKPAADGTGADSTADTGGTGTDSGTDTGSTDTSTDTSTGKTNAKPAAAATGDLAGACKYLKTLSQVTSKLKREMDYMCNQSSQLTSSPAGTMKTVSEKANGSFSDFMQAGWIKGKGTVEKLSALSKIYCKDPAKYKSIMGQAMADVEKIVPSNATDAGCDYQFFGRKIIFFQPQFQGHSADFASPGYAVSISYLVKEISLVKNASSLAVGVKQGDSVAIYIVSTSYVDTKGFAQQTKAGLEKGGTAGLAASVAYLAQ